MTPRIRTLDFVAGAAAARGLAVVIDVFRAFSLACYAVERGVARIHPVADAEQARALKIAHPDWLIAGERHARPLPGFDLGNSPSLLSTIDLAGRVLVHTTHAGTQGLCAALDAEEVITGSLVNAAAICRHVQARGASQVSLVRMGHEARERCPEDDLCAALLSARLRGESFPVGTVRESLRPASSARKFFDPAMDWAPESDFELCTDVDRFDFVLRLDGRDTELPWLTRVEV